MCGIIGQFSRDHRKLDIPTDGLKNLSHRGPDSSNTYFSENIALGHTRLSIIDLRDIANQPFESHDGRWCLVFNGEIYNYIELRERLIKSGEKFITSSDTEVLLHWLVKYGKNGLNDLRGVFAFALWDKCEKKLLMARDRFGEKPLYYYYNGDYLAFASEFKALVKFSYVPRELSPQALYDYLHYQYVPEPSTPIIGIKKLEKGHYLEASVDDYLFNVKSWWSRDGLKPVYGDPVELIRDAIFDSVKLMLRSDVKVGVALSAGIDSSAIAAIATNIGVTQLESFSVGYTGRPSYDERDSAAELAGQIDLPFHDVELDTDQFSIAFPNLVSYMDEPIGDIAAWGHYSVANLAHEHGCKVLLSGLGSDELFWGYSWLVDAIWGTINKFYPNQSVFELVSDKNKLDDQEKLSLKIKSWFKRKSSKNTDISVPNSAVFYDLIYDFNIAHEHVSRILSEEMLETIDPFGPYKIFYFDGRPVEEVPTYVFEKLCDTWLVSNCLALTDKVSMASSIEARMPFLDHRLADLVLGLRLTKHDWQLESKAWLRKALVGTLPQKVLDRPKTGFTPPVNEWIYAVVNNYSGILRDGTLSKVLNTNYIDSLLNNPIEKESPINFLLYKLILYSVWYEGTYR